MPAITVDDTSELLRVPSIDGASVPRAVARIVSQHEARTHNHTFLIMAMLIFEIAQEELFELPGHSGRDVA